MTRYVSMFYSKSVKNELQDSVKRAKILRCQQKMSFQWGTNQTEIITFWESMTNPDSFNALLENAWTWYVFFSTFYSNIVQTELQGSLESAKILECQCAILCKWSVSQTETLAFFETLGSFNFCLENAWTWKGRWHHFLGGIPWIMFFWSGFLVHGGQIWCFLEIPGEYRVPVSGRVRQFIF